MKYSNPPHEGADIEARAISEPVHRQHVNTKIERLRTPNHRLWRRLGAVAVTLFSFAATGAVGVYTSSAEESGKAPVMAIPREDAQIHWDELKLIRATRVRIEHKKEERTRQKNFEAGLEYVSAVAVFASKVVESKKIKYDPELFYRLHECEQPETWHAGGYFGNGLPSAGTGLGMSQDAWAMAVRSAASRGVTLPSSGWDASIDEQMQGAQAFWEDHGWGWGCHV